MYDMYWICDSDDIPSFPTHTHYVGSLELEEHQLLKHLWDRLRENNICLDYFSDSCIRSRDVTIVRGTISQLLHDGRMADSEIRAARKFDDMLRMAEAQGAGIIGFAD